MTVLFIAAIIQVYPTLVPELPVQVPRWALNLFYVLLVLRWPITPFVLNKLSKGTALVDSVSLRSIRGIRFTVPGLVRVECDRLGYSVHLFGKKANRRIGVTFDGLRLTVLHIPSKKADTHQRNHSLTPELSPLPHESHELSRKKASPMLEWLKSFLPEHWVLYLDEASRALVRRFFSVLVDFGLQVAPQIISTLSVSFTSVQVAFVELGGLNFTFKDASLGVSVTLQLVPEHQMTEEQRIELRAAQRSKAKHWRDRLAGTVSRTVMASWKGRQGTASVLLKLNNFTLFNPTPPPVRRQRAQSTGSVDSGGWTHFTDIDVKAPEHAVVHVSGETEISARCDFDPRKGRVAYHSTRIQSRVPDVTVFVDVLQALINDIQTVIPTTPTTPTDTGSQPSSPFPLTPLTAPMHSAPSSPLLSPLASAAFSVASSSAPRTKKPSKPKDRNLMQYFNSAGVEVLRFTVQYTSTKSKEAIQYKSQIIGLDFGLKLSDPKRDEIHTKWLGKSGKPTLETCKAWFRFTDVIVHRDHDLTSDDGHIRIIKTAGLDAQILLHQFPTPLLQRKGDATEPLVAIEIDMESIEATENLNLIRKRLARPSKVKPSNNEQIQQLQRLHNIPKLAVDIRVGDMKGRLICDDEKAFEQDVGLDVQFDSAELHIRSDYDQFKAPQKTSRIRGTRVSDCFPSYNFTVHAAIHSPCVRTTYATADEDFPSVTRPKLGAPSHGGFSRLEDPMLLLEGLEFHTTGNLIGKWTAEDIVLDRSSLMADVHLTIDVVHIELWTLSSLEALTYFLYQLKTARAKSSRRTPTSEPSQTNVMDALPSGIQVHAAIAKLSIGATGRDFNPECSLDLYRGLLISTSLMFRYSSVVTSKHNSRARGRFKLASAREKLRLPEDLLMQAFAHANESDDPKCRSALVEAVLSGTILRRVVGNQFGVDEVALNTPIAQVGHEAITLSIPRANARITLTRRVTPEQDLVDKANVIVDIKVIKGHLQLLDAYCGLLAMQTVRRLFGIEKKRQVKAPMTHVTATSSKMHVTVNGRIASAQFICQLPLDQVLHARWNVLSFNVANANSFDLKWTSASVLVPCGLFRKGYDRRWEELMRLPSWRIGIAKDVVSGEPSIEVLGDYARIRIPNGFVPADTILSVTLAVKAAKHLMDVTSTGIYSRMPTPPSEPAKNVPGITIKINGLLFEATDSPIEARLNLAFRHNIQAQRMRLEHEDAFDAKVAKIEAAAGKNANIRRVDEWNFTTEHSISINEARHRLRELFSNMWINQIQDARAIAMAREESMTMRFRENKFVENESALPVSLYVPPSYPPLFRLALNGVSATIRSPGWSGDQLASFMEDLGQGIPRDTEFTLLVPLHIELALDSARLVLRDLPLPILNVPPCADKKSLTFVTDLVIGEEIGPASSVRWVQCDVATEDADALGTAAFNVLIPKTTMPVKTYAQPEVKVSTTGITDICWGVSFLPIMQEVMKVIDGLSTLPVDPSPSLGFWDKLRLIMHWRTNIQFAGEVHVHLKGSRNAWKTTGSAVGIALCSRRNTRITIGHPNSQNELVQLLSDDMLIVIPSLKHFENSPSGLSTLDYELGPAARQPQKVIAKLVNGVRIGTGFTFERTCAGDCERCPPEADAFHRPCRMFDFKPHYEVALRADSEDKGKDSFLGFRSDFIHCGFSMHSPITPESDEASPNSIHLTPRVFAHLWSILRLFDNALALPIRQGKMWPGARPPSEKFGRHLATIKLRLCLDNLAIAHTYKQDSQDSWGNGEVPSVGVKALVKSLRADLHQRDEEIRSQAEEVGGLKSFKYTRAKSLYGVELRMTDIFMRAVVSIFREPDLQSVVSNPHPDFESPYSVAPLSSIHDVAFDKDDYTELDWLPTDQSPKFYMGEVASCPEFSFVKKIEDVRQPSDDPTQGVSKMSKFGSEPSHECIMGRELDPRQVQLSMATERKKNLEAELEELDPMDPSVDHYQMRIASLVQRINLLSTYIEKLLNPPPSATPSRLDGQLHGNWTDSDWEVFDNRYYVHAPKLSLSNGTRNILLQYYYESRRRRGFEYHMASSAVRFIRDHAMATEGRKEEPQPEPERAEPPAQARNKSGNAVKRLFVRQPEARKLQDTIAGPADVDHNIGTFEQTDTRRTHFCLLFKPQIVLRSNLDDESVIIISANDAAIQIANVMDKKIEDPVNGHMLTKLHFILSGMQIFSPSPLCSTANTGVQLPFEVFLDDLCETVEYDRIVLHTSCVVQYDKYNRLRLRTASQTTPQSDILLANVRSFTLQANSDHFSSLYNVVTDLLLYSDPSNRTRLDRLEAFILNDDISDSATTASEIAIRQGRIRALSEHLNDYTLREGDLRLSDRMEMNRIAATLMTQTEELGLIFDAVQMVQDRDELASQSKVGIRLEATSPELTWNLIDRNGSLLAKLALRSMDFLWISSQDGSSANRLKIKDLEAVDARLNAKFPEMISKQKKWLQDNPMAKSNTLLEVVWNTAAPVGGISILTNFDLSFHPINVQLDASVGHKIQTYIFPKDRSRRYHTTPDSGDGDTDQRSPDSDDQTDLEPTVPSRKSLDERPGRGMLKAPKVSLSRSSSHSDLGRATNEDGVRLRRVSSNRALGAHGKQQPGSNEVVIKPKLNDGVAEMRARSAENRTFVSARINCSGLCLSFRRDKDLSVIIPDINDLRFETPEIVFGNRTCSFRDILQEFKWELISKTGNVLLTSGGLKSFNFSGIKDRLLPGKRQIVYTRLEPPKPIHRQIGHVKDSQPSLSSDASLTSDSSSILAMSDLPPGRKSTSSNNTFKSSTRRTGSIDSGSGSNSRRSSDHGHGEDVETKTPRGKLMSLLHRHGSPRASPSRKLSALAPPSNLQS